MGLWDFLRAGVRANPARPAPRGRVYTPDEVLDEVGQVDGMTDPELHEAVRLFPRWRRVRWDPDRFYDREADEDMVQEYADAGPEGAPAALAIPGDGGVYDLLDGAHRRRAAVRAGAKLHAFVALDSGPGWVHALYPRRRPPGPLGAPRPCGRPGRSG